jgi:uncharacterized protein YdeI (YjbR/CyaY-like superfamily)
MKPAFFKSSLDWRSWLEANHDNCLELWVGFYKKSSGKVSVTYPEAVDEALCFGWIDGVRKSVAPDAYTVRFTPRQSKSQWSEVNRQRFQKLADAGRVRHAGLTAFADAINESRSYSYEQRYTATFSPDEQQLFRANSPAWEYFQAQPPWYRRTATFWVISAKKAETRERRLAVLISDSQRRRPIKPLSRPSVPKRKKKIR